MGKTKAARRGGFAVHYYPAIRMQYYAELPVLNWI
jgi:hypothetical protein